MAGHLRGGPKEETWLPLAKVNTGGGQGCSWLAAATAGKGHGGERRGDEVRINHTTPPPRSDGTRWHFRDSGEGCGAWPRWMRAGDPRLCRARGCFAATTPMAPGWSSSCWGMVPGRARRVSCPQPPVALALSPPLPNLPTLKRHQRSIPAMGRLRGSWIPFRGGASHPASKYSGYIKMLGIF